MYLSKVIIQNARCRDVYQFHQAIWQLFPSQPAQKRAFLFRIEAKHPGRGADVLLQSMEAPASSAAAQVLACKPLAFHLKEGDQLRFRLRANPIKTIKDEQQRLNGRGEIKRCRVPLLKEQEQHQWLIRKFSLAARLEHIESTSELPLFFSKNGMGGKIQPMNFEGILTVTSVPALLSLLNNGVGPAKAMGCGLLSLARP